MNPQRSRRTGRPASLRVRAVRLCLLILFTIPALGVGAAAAQQTAPPTAGPVVLIGGVLRYDNGPVWRRIIALAGGDGARFVVVATATGRPQIYGAYAVRALTRRGAEATLLPIAPATEAFGRAPAQAVRDEALIAQVRDATGIFFTGGAPQRIAEVLFEADGSPTPLLQAIRRRHAEGAVIAGANAGAVAIATGNLPLPALRDGLSSDAVQPALGLLGDDLLVDQHLFTHGRLGVTLAALQSLHLPRAFGIDLDTAAVVRGGRHVEVVGEGGALLIDRTRASSGAGFPLTATGLTLSYLGDGDHLDLATLDITPSPAKAEGFRIAPAAPDHVPWLTGRHVAADVFAPDALPALLFHALDSDASESLGLVTTDDGGVAFHFRFYRDRDSHGWLLADAGRPRYTAVGIRLDVTPADGEPDASLPAAGAAQGPARP